MPFRIRKMKHKNNLSDRQSTLCPPEEVVLTAVRAPPGNTHRIFPYQNFPILLKRLFHGISRRVHPFVFHQLDKTLVAECG